MEYLWYVALTLKWGFHASSLSQLHRFLDCADRAELVRFVTTVSALVEADSGSGARRRACSKPAEAASLWAQFDATCGSYSESCAGTPGATASQRTCAADLTFRGPEGSDRRSVKYPRDFQHMQSFDSSIDLHQASQDPLIPAIDPMNQRTHGRELELGAIEADYYSTAPWAARTAHLDTAHQWRCKDQTVAYGNGTPTGGVIPQRGMYALQKLRSTIAATATTNNEVVPFARRSTADSESREATSAGLANRFRRRRQSGAVAGRQGTVAKAPTSGGAPPSVGGPNNLGQVRPTSHDAL